MSKKEIQEALVLYHANCLDGLGAAYAAWLKLGYKGAIYRPVQYGDPIPEDANGRDVYLLDFSFKKDLLLNLLDIAKSVTILDHHETAEKDLKALFSTSGLKGRFDGSKSGAVLAFEWFNPSLRVPDLLLSVQDRDLWQFKFDDTKFVNNFLWHIRKKLSEDFAEYHDQVQIYEINPEDLAVPGQIIEELRRQQIEHLKSHARLCHGIPIVNCPTGLHSEVIGELSVGHSFALGFYIIEDKIIVGLRSDKDSKASSNVAEIAERNGGGGHRHSAGFTVELDAQDEMIFDYLHGLS